MERLTNEERQQTLSYIKSLKGSKRLQSICMISNDFSTVTSALGSPFNVGVIVDIDPWTENLHNQFLIPFETSHLKINAEIKQDMFRLSGGVPGLEHIMGIMYLNLLKEKQVDELAWEQWVLFTTSDIAVGSIIINRLVEIIFSE
eukprot:TRINITY_DN6220_c0_g1_i2.p1 TRINITY_DN6220_c0_g1~~TRINITY_DN6220_c0_g1_i2.p1  ORF type:complete len:145 (+),score=4.65 TRINITY_DN6220_c0_g1_i2:397-831(+)